MGRFAFFLSWRAVVILSCTLHAEVNKRGTQTPEGSVSVRIGFSTGLQPHVFVRSCDALLSSRRQLYFSSWTPCSTSAPLPPLLRDQGEQIELYTSMATAYQKRKMLPQPPLPPSRWTWLRVYMYTKHPYGMAHLMADATFTSEHIRHTIQSTKR